MAGRFFAFFAKNWANLDFCLAQALQLDEYFFALIIT
jgi:hypothetical protein